MPIDGGWTASESYPGFVSAEALQALVDQVEALSAGLGTGVEGGFSSVADRIAGMEDRIPPPPPVLPALGRIYRAVATADLPISIPSATTYDLALNTQVDSDQNVTGGPTTFTLTAPGVYAYDAFIQLNMTTGAANWHVTITHGGVALASPGTNTAASVTLSGVANGYIETAGATVKLSMVMANTPPAGLTIIGAWLKVRPLVVT